MPVVATQVNGETVQSVGAHANIVVASETSWGTTPATATRIVRNLPGETLDQNFHVYASRQIRGDRMRNAPVIGTQDPGGGLPFELSPDGWNWALYSLFAPSAIVTTGPTGGITNPGSAITALAATTGGSITTNATYYYVYTISNTVGETKFSPVSSGIAIDGVTNTKATGTIPAASGVGNTVNVYRGTAAAGPFFYVGTYAGASGTIALSDGNGIAGLQAPNENTTGQYYTHIINAGTTGFPLPIGHSIEKQFIIPEIADSVYQIYRGQRADKMTLNFKVDQMAEGMFDFVGQTASDRNTTGGGSYFTGVMPPQQILPPYTSAQVSVYEAGNANPIGLCNDLQLTVENQYHRRSGYILGYNYRQNLKPGTRLTSFVGKFLFQDENLYHKSINATNSALKIVCTDATGVFSHTFHMGTIRFTPSASAPKITDDGPLEITLHGVTLPDEADGTDIRLTVVTPEADLTN